MQFHPFKLDYFSKENFSKVKLEDVIKVKEKNRIKVFTPLLYIECPFLNKKIYVGDTFYDRMKKIFFIFSVVKEKIPYTEKETKCGAKSFGFILLIKDNVSFLPYVKSLAEETKELTYLGNIFDEKQNISDLMPEEIRDDQGMSDAIYQLFKENNLNLYIKIPATEQTNQKIIKLKNLLSLHAAFLKSMKKNSFTIKLYACRNENVCIEGFSGDLFLLKETLNHIENIYSLVSPENENKLQGKTMKYLKNIMNYHSEVFIALNFKNAIVHYINPNMENVEDNDELYFIELYYKSNYYDRIGYDLENQFYNNSFLKLL